MSVPSVLSAASCACNAVVCVAHAVSGARMLVMMLLTVDVTSKPAPLVADPKLIPTTDILHCSPLPEEVARALPFLTCVTLALRKKKGPDEMRARPSLKTKLRTTAAAW